MKNNTCDTEDILRIVRCSKAAYLHNFRPELKTKTPKLESSFRRLEIVKALARSLYKGPDIRNREFKTYQESINYTKYLISKRAKVIHHACFENQLGRCQIDILCIENGRWKIYQIASSTKLWNDHILSLSHQAKIIKSCFPEAEKMRCYVIHLNNMYVRKQKLEPRKLFRVQEVTHRTRLAECLIDRFSNIGNKILGGSKIPNTPIGSQCSRPYDCDFKKYCWKDLPDNSVFDLSRMWEVKKFILHSQGYEKLEDIPRQVRLGEDQWMQIDCAVQKRHVFNALEIEEYLKDVNFPLYFVSFGTLQYPIPLYKKTWAYCHLPFQYSIHKLTSPDSNLEHFEFLSARKADPRQSFIRNLLGVVGETGAIFTYGKTFEERRLQELARDFPKYAKRIENLIKRMIDLRMPFDKRFLYHPTQKGNSSLKAVLSAWVPELSFNDLSIINKDDAVNQYEKLLLIDISNADKSKIRENLLEFERKNSYSGVRVLKILESIASLKSYPNN